jgi:hypothetical protein
VSGHVCALHILPIFDAVWRQADAHCEREAVHRGLVRPAQTHNLVFMGPRFDDLTSLSKLNGHG